jgi:hypothetical protein
MTSSLLASLSPLDVPRRIGKTGLRLGPFSSNLYLVLHPRHDHVSITSFIGWVTSLLPTPLRAKASPEKQLLLEEFTRFGLVGSVGFCVDAGIVY